jgi:hypothetical protein
MALSHTQPGEVVDVRPLGYSFIPCLDGPLELTTPEVETDSIATRRLIKFQKSHDVQCPARA